AIGKIKVGNAQASGFNDPQFIKPGPQGLLGEIITITGGAGKGQTRLIASNDDNTITIDRPWATLPDATSTYQITRFGAVELPSVAIHVNDKDQGGLSVGQADATISVREYDSTLGLTNVKQAQDGFTDTFTVALPDAPTAPVTVFLASSANPVDPAHGQHLTFT